MPGGGSMSGNYNYNNQGGPMGGQNMGGGPGGNTGNSNNMGGGPSGGGMTANSMVSMMIFFKIIKVSVNILILLDL